jgi:hypothetical protein
MSAITQQVPEAEPDAATPVEAMRGVGERVAERLRCERAERERRKQLAEMRASLSDEALEALKRRAEEALAAEGVARTHLGYDVLAKLKVDDLLDQEGVPVSLAAEENP